MSERIDRWTRVSGVDEFMCGVAVVAGGEIAQHEGVNPLTPGKQEALSLLMAT